MKNYTAIYSTAYITNIHYSFRALNMERAKAFVAWYISVKDVIIVEDED